MKKRILYVLIALCGCGGIEYHREYFPDGSIKEEYEIKKGLANGLGRKFYEDGTISYEGNFIDGGKEGWHVHFGRDGQATHKALYEIVDGQVRCLRRIKLRHGEIESETVFAKKNIEAIYNDNLTYRVGDTVRLKLKLHNPKYIYCEAAIGPFDEFLNLTEEPIIPLTYVPGTLSHEVFVRLIMEFPGKQTINGHFRDFEYYPMTDSTGRVVGEDSFFNFEVDVDP
jgi:hypothetical protein